MSEPVENPKPEPRTPGRLFNALEAWDAEAGSQNFSSLSALRLDANERLLVPFSVQMQHAEVHYLDYPSVRGYFHCNGGGCLLCRIGNQKDVRDLWPVYDVLAQAVVVLPISRCVRPRALRPQLTPVLRALQDGEYPVLLGIRREGYKFFVSTTELPSDADAGVATWQAFLKQLEEGKVDLGSVYPRTSNELLARIPEVARIMHFRGIHAA
jgi:hypothetical protein